MEKLFFTMGLLLVLQAGQASELYRWVDNNGKVHYGDTPEVDAEKLKFSIPDTDAASGVDETNLPYEVRLARKNFPVTLYVSEKCGEPCKQARDFLDKRHVPFAETELKTQEEFDDFKQKSGSDSVPVLSVGRNWLKGFQAGQWQDELDAAGYPK
ncbi:MAG TPA: glutaredoxin family protein [Gallionellaceae bacterium]|nr:glutaredoxin family protein [Gallionellaceae bacterium]